MEAMPTDPNQKPKSEMKKKRRKLEEEKKREEETC